MLSTRKCIRPRSLHPPTAWVCNQPMIQSPLVLRDRSNLPSFCQYSDPNVSLRRAFSWGKRRHWNCPHDVNVYKLLEARSRTLKDGRCGGLHHNYLGDRGHSNYRYSSNRGWRLSGAGGRPGYGWGESSFSKSGKMSEEPQEEWSKLYLKKKEDLEKSLEDFQREVDADPYGALFGWRLGKKPYPDSNSANENTTNKGHIFPDEGKNYVDDTVSKPSQAGKDHIQETKEEWYKLYLKGMEDGEKSFENFKKKVDADPYGALFGWRSGKRPYTDSTSANENATSKEPAFPDEGKQCIDDTSSKPSQAGKDHVQESESCLHHSYPEAKASLSHDDQVEEFVFDPITMRKVPKKPSRPVPNLKKNAIFADGESSIPVKRFTTEKPLADENTSPFQPPKKTPSKQSYPPGTTGAVQACKPVQPQRNWLAQEGFGTENPVVEPFRAGSQSKHSTKDIYPKPFKIESSLDRHLRSKRTTPDNFGTDHPALKHKAEQNTIEDIDLLRASDVRASAGLGGRSPKETGKEKQERRKVLENDYEMRPRKLDARLAEEVATQKSLRAKTSASLLNKTSGREAEVGSSVESAHGLNRSHESHQSESEIRKKNAAKSALEEEVKAQKIAMEAAEMHSGREAKPAKAQRVQFQESGEGDMASNVHEFVDRDRWYKQRAPHAIEESELKLQQKVKDMALIREVRSIYEDEYGTINTQHRQPSRQVDRKEKAENTQNSRVPMSSQPSASLHTSEPNTSSTKRTKDRPEIPEVLRIIRKSIIELRQAQSLFRKHYKQYPNAVVPSDLLRSSAAFEQRFMQTLRGALELFEPSVETSAGIAVGTRKPDIPATAAAPAVGDSEATKPVLAHSKSSTPTFYKILAYDPSTQRVSAAKTSSMTTALDETPLTLVEALSKLATPAKFLPHFASLQISGYEVVSAGTNILIFRKFGSAKQSTLHIAEDTSFITTEKYPRHTNPIDGMTTRTGNFASPTGFVNHDAILPPSEEDGRPLPPYPWNTKADDKVTRQEEVFSGSRTPWQDDRNTGSSSSNNSGNKLSLWKKQRRARRRKRTLKRMLKLGLFVAAYCYLLGLVSELGRS